jgi:chromosome partitioning protein
MAAYVPAREGPFIITLHGGKGGIGKTTIAEHLAWGFSDYGKTLQVDADGGQQSAKALYDRYRVPAPYDVAVETDPRLLGNLRRVPHKYVIIDGPPSAAEAQAAIEAADLVLVPLVPRVMDISAVMRTIKATLADRRPYQVVITRVQSNMGNSRVEAVRGALQGNGVPVLSTKLREYMGPHELARTHGLPVTHPQVVELSTGDAAQERARRAAMDLTDLFKEVATLAGVEGL